MATTRNSNNATLRAREIARRKREARRMRRLLNRVFFSFILIATACLSVTTIHASKQNKELTEKVNTLTSENLEMATKISGHNKIVADLHEIIKDQDLQIKNLSTKNKSMVDELNQLRTRSELYNKYEYAVIDEIGERTHLTYEEIKLGEELMLAKGYDPHLMMGSIMVESHGNPSAVNSSSGATGYGQFLNSTAKWVWTDLLGNPSYHADIRKDGESNIRMMAEYYDYLYNTVGSTFNVIKSYSGNSTDEGTAGYIKKINSHTNRVGVTIK